MIEESKLREWEAAHLKSCEIVESKIHKFYGEEFQILKDHLDLHERILFLIKAYRASEAKLQSAKELIAKKDEFFDKIAPPGLDIPAKDYLESHALYVKALAESARLLKLEDDSCPKDQE